MNQLHPTSSVENLEYPIGIGKNVASGHHYMMITSYESVTVLQRGKQKSSIALYIPPNALKTTIGANFEGLAGGITMAKTAGSLGVGGGDVGLGTGEGGFFGTVGDLLSGLAAKTDVSKNAFAAASGLAVNNHMALVYRGPSEFRKHDFVFQFFPKSKTEAGVMLRIISDFKNGMTPRLASITKGKNQRLTAPFFKSPRQYEISFHKGDSTNNTYLPKIGTSVLMSMTVNHDPQGIVGFHEDGAPVQTTMSLNFQETEYLLSGDAASLDEASVQRGQEAISSATDRSTASKK